MATQAKDAALFYSPDDLFGCLGHGTAEQHLANVRARLMALDGPDAADGFREVEAKAMAWREMFDRPTYPENREAIREFLNGMTELLREARGRCGVAGAP